MELSANRTHGLTNGDENKLNVIRNRSRSNKRKLVQKNMKEIN
jgi:hypothetical protein